MFLFIIILLLIILGFVLAWLFGFGRRPDASVERTRIETMLAEGKLSEGEARELVEALGPASFARAERPPDGHIRAAAITLIAAGVFLLIVGGLNGWTAWEKAEAIRADFAEAAKSTPDTPGGVEVMMRSFQRIALAVFFFALGVGGSSLIAGMVLYTARDRTVRNRARSVAVALGAVMLIGVPIGTVIGAYLLWVLAFRKQASSYF